MQSIYNFVYEDYVRTNLVIFETAYYFPRMGAPFTRNLSIRSPKPHCFETALQSGLGPVHTNPDK